MSGGSAVFTVDLQETVKCTGPAGRAGLNVTQLPGRSGPCAHEQSTCLKRQLGILQRESAQARHEVKACAEVTVELWGSSLPRNSFMLTAVSVDCRSFSSHAC